MNNSCIFLLSRFELQKNLFLHRWAYIVFKLFRPSSELYACSHKTDFNFSRNFLLGFELFWWQHNTCDSIACSSIECSLLIENNLWRCQNLNCFIRIAFSYIHENVSFPARNMIIGWKFVCGGGLLYASDLLIERTFSIHCCTCIWERNVWFWNCCAYSLLKQFLHQAYRYCIDLLLALYTLVRVNSNAIGSWRSFENIHNKRWNIVRFLDFEYSVILNIY